jgi:hypothetical protein
MPPAMGQPINVVEKPSKTPGLARFETNRSLTGMGHERYASVDDILSHRPVDELARRLFESGGVTQIHANGSMITVHLADGWSGAQLLDVIRSLYTYYPPGAASTNGDAPAGDAPVGDAPAGDAAIAGAADAADQAESQPVEGEPEE